MWETDLSMIKWHVREQEIETQSERVRECGFAEQLCNWGASLRRRTCGRVMFKRIKLYNFLFKDSAVTKYLCCSGTVVLIRPFFPFFSEGMCKLGMQHLYVFVCETWNAHGPCGWVVLKAPWMTHAASCLQPNLTLLHAANEGLDRSLCIRVVKHRTEQRVVSVWEEEVCGLSHTQTHTNKCWPKTHSRSV